MKKLLFIALLAFQFTFAQQSYYSDVDLTLTGQDLYNALQIKISQHNQNFTYGDARDVLVFTDENPENTANVLLVYGYNDNDGNCTTDRSRNKNGFGGNVCEYNREHVFARSNSNPSMEFNGSTNNQSTGIVADPHNIRASDQQMNNNKGSKKFQNGSGNAGNVGSGNWYPGDEWKGDVARMMMYMYTRYGDQCLPSLNGFGSLQGGTQMLQTYLQWNADDPVNDYEDQRNDFLQGAYGNRNPFIDNPALATIIWGGAVAEDRWGILSSQNLTLENLTIFPNPAKNNSVTVSSSSEFNSISIYDINGRVINKYNNLNTSKHIIELDKYRSGFYLVQIQSVNQSTTKKLLVL
jgi:endonuclease I